MTRPGGAGGGRRPIVVAHRGGAAEAPENTLDAFRRAVRLGYPGVEFDVRRSRDGVPVVVHDEQVPPRGGGRRRPVADLDAREIDAPSLEETLALAWGSTVLMVEVKPTGADAALGAEVARAVLGHGLAAQAVVASFSPAVLRAVAAEAPHLRLMGLLDDEADEAAFEGLPVSAWGVAVALVRADRVARWKRGGRQVWTWTVVNRDQARRAVEAGVDGLIADIPGAVLEGLVRPGPAV